ncbi:iron-containing alcohol dehydrogenase [Cupriavidus sp. IDO]|uniref:iron-containing alcohol dehydrogenase n=1 Tax=Cupriavidus sp. IDO TaxID=1539142 RepID=UPI0005792515|nr:iron-containing alcohol dehydrogenase [Cupriavidus sp. IDO]KWR90626.1 alcohol dehydrogenase [Cupriavidus sp. IDO]
MNSFNFETTRRIICQRGACSSLGGLARGMGIRRAFLVTDEGLHRTGLTALAIESLQKQNVEVTLCIDVLADPPEETIGAAAAKAREARVDGVIGFGGGSSLDTAKLVALLVQTPQEMNRIYGVGLAQGPRLPLIQIPTTAGTGSEVTPISVVTTPTDEKKPVVSSLLLPDVALLDPELTIGLPPAVTAATGIDAMVHAIEALTTHLKQNELSNMLAIKAVQMIFKNLLPAVTDGQDIEARERMLLASLYAGMAFSNASVGAVHAFAYPLGVRFHVPHGLSNSLMLPHILRFNLEAGEATYAQLGRAIRSELSTASDKVAAKAFVDSICDLVSQMPYAQRLRDVGVKMTDVSVLTADVLKIQRLLAHNPKEITPEDALALYTGAF